MYYYGARYYDPKTSIWLSVDPLAVYNPVMETEFYGDGQHNGGVYNSGNNNPYLYCYQSPVIYVDPNGKQVYFMTPPTEPISAEGASLMADFTPGLGDVKGFFEGIAGRDILGNDLSGFDRGLSLLCLSELRGVKNASRAIKELDAIRKITKPLWGSKVFRGVETAMEHIEKGHFFDARKGQLSSRFSQALSNEKSIKNLVQTAVSKGKHAGEKGNYNVIHTFNEVIGTDSNGKKTKTLQVYLDKAGNVLNAYPVGKPKD